MFIQKLFNFIEILLITLSSAGQCKRLLIDFTHFHPGSCKSRWGFLQCVFLLLNRLKVYIILKQSVNMNG